MCMWHFPVALFSGCPCTCMRRCAGPWESACRQQGSPVSCEGLSPLYVVMRTLMYSTTNYTLLHSQLNRNHFLSLTTPLSWRPNFILPISTCFGFRTEVSSTLWGAKLISKTRTFQKFFRNWKCSQNPGAFCSLLSANVCCKQKTFSNAVQTHIHKLWNCISMKGIQR